MGRAGQPRRPKEMALFSATVPQCQASMLTSKGPEPAAADAAYAERLPGAYLPHRRLKAKGEDLSKIRSHPFSATNFGRFLNPDQDQTPTHPIYVRVGSVSFTFRYRLAKWFYPE